MILTLRNKLGGWSRGWGGKLFPRGTCKLLGVFLLGHVLSEAALREGERESLIEPTPR